MILTDIEAAVKKNFRITTATLNADVTDAATRSVRKLAPYIKKSVVDASTTINSSTTQFNLPGALAGADIRRISVKSGTSEYADFRDYFKEGDTIFLRSFVTDSTTVRLIARVAYKAADIAVIPETYQPVLEDFASAEFAAMLAGDKSRYNIYAQSNGSRAVDNMLDLSEFYENKARRAALDLGGSEALA